MSLFVSSLDYIMVNIILTATLKFNIICYLALSKWKLKGKLDTSVSLRQTYPFIF